jgi:Family of unknown function (DUF5681)
MSDDVQPEASYEVGYGRPPKHTQFKPGRSGNPRGRPRKSKAIEAMIREELDSTIVLKENGRELRISKREAIIKRLVNSAIKGDTKPLQMMIAHLEKHREIEPFVPSDADDLALLKSISDRSEGDDV